MTTTLITNSAQNFSSLSNSSSKIHSWNQNAQYCICHDEIWPVFILSQRTWVIILTRAIFSIKQLPNDLCFLSIAPLLQNCKPTLSHSALFLVLFKMGQIKILAKRFFALVALILFVFDVGSDFLVALDLYQKCHFWYSLAVLALIGFPGFCYGWSQFYVHTCGSYDRNLPFAFFIFLTGPVTFLPLTAWRFFRKVLKPENEQISSER